MKPTRSFTHIDTWVFDLDNTLYPHHVNLWQQVDARIGEFVSRPPRGSLGTALELLTNREREVVALAARGLSNDEIAADMVISPATAKTHVSRAMTKLAARDRAQLVVFAYESGLVEPRR